MRSGPSSLSDNGGSSGQSSTTGVVPAAFAPSYLEIKGWCGFRDRRDVPVANRMLGSIL